ncbi:DNA polymerase IV [Bacillota bacterium LX-D]|nr:DNA polymerase IV [Bacillota bacterium LX-D]
MGKRIIFHIDVNSAYLSWEAICRLQRGDSIDLREIPSAVGGDPSTRHGIILAKSIPAKKYKIQTGETLFSAKMKCPELIIVPPNYELYMKCSLAMLEILKEYSPCIQRFSIDECFLDYTNMENHFGEPIKAAHKIKDRIKKELGFTVNIGISTNKLLAKMASELEKPDKVHTIFPEEISEKMWTLPVGDLFMVGRATLAKLQNYAICTIGDLAKTDPQFLKRLLKSHGILIWNYANGYDNTPVKDNATIPIKGIGNSTTTAFDVDNLREAKMVLLSLVETVAARLRQNNYSTQLISVSFRTNEFFSYGHQRKLHTTTNSTNQIYQIVCQLFKEIWQGQPIRHLGVRVGELCSNDFEQIALFAGNLEKERSLDKAIDKIRAKYGSKALFRSTFLQSGIKEIAGGVIQEEDYPMMSSLL